MPTKRKWITVRCTGTTLIVAGGWGEGDRVLSTVEVMDTETHQWFTAADLPEPTYQASATVCGDQLYVLGRMDKDRAFIKSVYTCSVSALVGTQTRTRSNRKYYLKSPHTRNGRQWSMCYFSSLSVH